MFLGIDLGTSELKTLLLDGEHRVLATASAPLSVQRPQPLWSEQHPADWWQALDQALAALGAQHSLRGVQAIGLSGQMHGAVLLDKAGRVLRPAILWNDGRSGAQCAQLLQREPRTQAITGNLAMPGFTAPKLLWVQQHEPGVFAQTARVLLPKDWLRLQLTGEAATDLSDASGTLWLDVAQRGWSPAMLAATGLGERHMPRLVEGCAVAGHLLPEVAARWGLPPGVPLAGGGGDNAASAVGMGAVMPGQGFVSLGTSGVVFVSGDRFAPNPARGLHAFCHALPGRWHQMSVMLAAASAVDWAATQFGFGDAAGLHQVAAGCGLKQAAQAPLFLPYLSGERTPHNNPQAQGALVGLVQGQDRAALAYAVLEGVVLGLLDGWLTLDAVDRAAVQRLSVVGGGARSALWVQLLASALGVTMVTHSGSAAGGALGAARLAWLATLGGVGGGAPDDRQLALVCPPPPVAQTFQPDPAWQALLGQRHARFTALYPLLNG